MSATNAGTPHGSAQGLPHEPGSASELLKATHLFTIYIERLDAEAWSLGEDGLEHRRLSIKAMPVEVYKGVLSLPPRQPFDFVVQQSRETGLVVSDYHGLWSHFEPQRAGHYLVVAEGAQQDPAVLLQEPQCKMLLDAGRALDVQLAIKVEKFLNDNPLAAADEDGQIERLSALLRFAQQQGTVGQELFANYLWARIQPIMAAFPRRAMALIAPFIETSEMDIRFHQAFIDTVYKGILDLDSPLEARRPLLSSVLRVLLQPSAKPMRSSLVDVYAFNLIFRPGVAPPPASQLLDARVPVEQAAKVAGEVSPDRGKQVAAWLLGR